MSHQQSFSYKGTGLPWLNQYLARINVLAQGHNAVMPVRLEPAALRSRVKHSTTELPPVFLRVAVLHRFYCIMSSLIWIHMVCSIIFCLSNKHKVCNIYNLTLIPQVLLGESNQPQQLYSLDNTELTSR